MPDIAFELFNKLSREEAIAISQIQKLVMD
jgi:hypothetical protein